MRHERWVSGLIAGVLAFFIGFAGVMCITTGFSLQVKNLALLVFVCAAYCAVAAFFFSRKRGGLLLAGLWAIGVGFLWRSKLLGPGIESLLYTISRHYSNAYGWAVIRWSGGDPALVPPDMGLYVIALGIMTAVMWTLCRRKPAVFAVILGLVPLILCLVVTNTVPAGWCLFMLLVSVVLLMLTNTVRRKNPRDGNRLTALLLVPVMLATALLFWAVPREGYTAVSDAMQQNILSWFQGLPFVQMDFNGELGIGIGGTSTGMVDLTQIGPKTKFSYAVMNVTAARSECLYLRGQALDAYDGKSWRASDIANGADSGWPASGLTIGEGVEIETLSGHPLLYFPYYPAGELWTNDFTEGALENPKRLRRYSFTRMDQMQNTNLPVLTAEEEARYLALPYSAERLMRSYGMEMGIYSKKLSVSEIAATVKEYVQNSAEYDLNTEKMPQHEKDFAVWFLDEADTGYCVHFATAATVLLRSAGVPARYVTGYVAYTRAGEEVTVTADLAHAWVEYFEPYKGWQILDATPADWSPGATEVPSEDTEPTESTEPSSEPNTKPTLPPEQPTQPSLNVTLPSKDPFGDNPKKEQETGWLLKLLCGLGILAGVCLLIGGQYGIRLHCRRKKMHTGSSNQRALRRWREVLRYSKLLKKAPPEALLQLAEKAKFSQHSLSAAERLEFDRYLSACSGELAEKPLIVKLFIRLVWAVE